MPVMRLLLILSGLMLLVVPATGQEQYDIITPENAGHLERVARLGRGFTGDIHFENNDTLVIRHAYFSQETWRYDTRDMSVPPVFTPDPRLESIEYRDHYPPNVEDNKAGIWRSTREGIVNTVTGETVLRFPGEAYRRDTQRRLSTSNLLIVWREIINDNFEPDETCADNNTACLHQVLVFHIGTEQVIYEIYADDVSSIELVRDETHLAVGYAYRTDFYHLTQRGLNYNFSLPTVFEKLYPAHGLAVDISEPRTRLEVWDLRARSSILQVNFLPGEPISLHDISSDGRFLTVATAAEYVAPDEVFWMSPEHNITIWDLSSGTRRYTGKYPAWFFQIIFSPNRQYFALFTKSNINGNHPSYPIHFVTVHELDSGREIARIDNNIRNSATDMAFSPDERLFATVFSDGRIVLVDTASGSILSETLPFPGEVWYVHTTDNLIITASRSGHSDLWDINTLAHVQRLPDCPIINLLLNTSQALCASFYNDFPGLFIRPAWMDLETLERIPIQNNALADTYILHATFSPDGTQMITTTGNYNDSPLVWDVETEDLLATLDTGDFSEPVRDVQYLAGGTVIGSRSQGLLWDAETFKIIAQVSADVPQNQLGVYSEAGDFAAFPVKAPDLRPENWNTDADPIPERVVIWRLSDLLNNPDPQPVAQIDEAGGIGAASPDGQLLMMGTHLIDMTTFEIVERIPVRGYEVAFSPDGRYLITADGILIYSGENPPSPGSANIWAVPR